MIPTWSGVRGAAYGRTRQALFVSAPRAHRAVTDAVFSSVVATRKGVRPPPPCALMFAPPLKSCLIAPTWSPEAAVCRAVRYPFEFPPHTSTPFNQRISMAATLPMMAATSRGVVSSSWERKWTSAPATIREATVRGLSFIAARWSGVWPSRPIACTCAPCLRRARTVFWLPAPAARCRRGPVRALGVRSRAKYKLFPQQIPIADRRSVLERMAQQIWQFFYSPGVY